MGEARKHSQALVVLPDSFLMIQRERVVELAARHKLPAIYGLREFVDSGGLIAYAPDMIVLFRRAAEYVDKILKGARPADLPIEEPRQMKLTVNLKTARELGLDVPESILLRAQEVIR